MTKAPDHTDLMVTPESIDAFLEANPLPVFKAAMTREELLASDDPADADFLEMIFQHDTMDDFEGEDPDDEEEFYEPEDQDQGDSDCERFA